MDIYGIFGYPIAHSRSPQMHNRTFQKLGIDAVYVPFLIEPNRLAEAVAALRVLNIRGVNITIPHKEAVLKLLDELAPEAHLIGAVNTIVNRDGHLVGHNTDCLGFMRSLRHELNFEPKDKRILLLGAGGAGRAVTVGLAQAGAAQITLFDQRETVCHHLIDEFAPRFENIRFACFSGDQTSLLEKMSNFDLLINATPVGMKGECWFDGQESLLPPHVYDLVYSPQGTPLTRAAQSAGKRVVDGTGMLAAQGEEAFFLWRGQYPPAGWMKQCIRD